MVAWFSQEIYDNGWSNLDMMFPMRLKNGTLDDSGATVTICPN